MSLSAGKLRASAMDVAMKQWASADIFVAVTYANAHPELQIELMNFYQGLTNLADKAPRTAANLALSFKNIGSRSAILSGVIDVWVERDATAAFQWAHSLTKSELREDVVSQAVSAWADSNPTEALNYAQNLTDNDTRIKSFNSAWKRWFDQAPDDALSYLHVTKDSKLFESISYIISSKVQRSSGYERKALLGKIPESQFKQQIYQSLAGIHIRNGQYNEALSMLNAMTDSTSRDRQVTQFVQKWAKEDFAAATAWLKIQPDSSDRDLAQTGYSFALSQSNPGLAIQQVLTISDPALRRDALKLIAFRWYQSDAKSAEAWMKNSSGFSAADKKFVRFKAGVPGDYMPLTPTVSQRR